MSSVVCGFHFRKAKTGQVLDCGKLAETTKKKEKPELLNILRENFLALKIMGLCCQRE